MPYVGHSPQEEKRLLAAIGVESFEELIGSIPENLRAHEPIAIPPGQSELEIRRLFHQAERENYDPLETPTFLGGGLYDHEIPSVVSHMQQRSEFYTAYTPYQPEVAQGTLITIFEFQTMICELTGMEVANASMYDAASAAAEAALLAANATGRRKILVGSGFHPHHRAILETYGRPPGLEFVDVGSIDSALRNDLDEALDASTAALIVQQPDFFGRVKSIAEIAAQAHEAGAMLIVSADPVCLALLEPPGKLGADLVVGEGQTIGTPPSYGGPAAGFFAGRRESIRRLPGRLVAETVDRDGRRGFVLTLQTREQHIRREKATSNICTNNNLIALGFTIALATLGPKGLRRMAEQSMQKAHYLERALCSIPGVTRDPDGPFIHEFALNLPRPAGAVIREIYKEAGILAGIDLGRYDRDGSNRILIAVTEKRTRAEIDSLIEAMGKALL